MAVDLDEETGLRVYGGTAWACPSCNREFVDGQVVNVTPDQQLAFCHSDPAGMTLCLDAYAFLEMEPVDTIIVNPMVFRVPTPSPAPVPKRWWQFWK